MNLISYALQSLSPCSVDAYWHPLTPEHGFPSLRYKTQGAPPQSASPFCKGMKKQEDTKRGILLQ